MTIATAQQLLNQRLHFGDAHQLAALRFLRQVAEFRIKLMKCKHCDGEGTMRNGTPCLWCAAGYDADVLAALGIEAKE